MNTNDGNKRNSSQSNSTSNSNSSQSTSLYETPINSPTNESLLESIAIDLTQTSNISETIDLLDSRQSLETLTNRSIQSTPISIETISTLKAQEFPINSNPITNSSINETLYKQMTQSMKNSQNISSIPESSIWFRRQTLPSNNGYIDSNLNNSEKYSLLLKYMSELDCEHLQIIGLEQQINSISLQCKTIRENIASKTNCIYSLINDIILSKERQSEQMKTQSETETQTETVGQQFDLFNRNKLFSGSPKSVVSRKDFMAFSSNSNSAVDNSHKTIQTESQFSNFRELSNDTKNALSRLPALVKGYLTRRLMKTEKVLNIMKTIQDTTQLLLNFKNGPNNRPLTQEDINFHKRLIIQLETACHQFYDIFFNYPKSAQMALISRSRGHILERQYRTDSVLSNSSNLTSSLNSSLLSSVTKKLIEKRSQKNENISAVNKSQSQSRTYSGKNLTVNSSLAKKNSSQSLKICGMSSSSDSNIRMNPNLRRSQRNTTKTKLLSVNRKSITKRY